MRQKTAFGFYTRLIRMNGFVIILIVAMPLISIPAEAADEAPIVQANTIRGCLTIPTSISLNDDCSSCRRLNITSSCPIDYFRIEISDRWGNKVYTTYDIQRQWDGSQGNSYLPVGCYTYMILYRQSPDSALLIYKGTVLFLH